MAPSGAAQQYEESKYREHKIHRTCATSIFPNTASNLFAFLVITIYVRRVMFSCLTCDWLVDSMSVSMEIYGTHVRVPECYLPDINSLFSNDSNTVFK